MLWCPGAMRLVESVIGKLLVAVGGLAGHDRVVPRLAGDHLPVGSGALVDDLGEQRADVVGRQPRRSGTWTACMPRSPMQPYSPLVAMRRFQLIGLFGLRSLQCQ